MREIHIPQGRGIEKWRPFCSMPQQFAELHKLIRDQTKVSKPILDLQKIRRDKSSIEPSNTDKRRCRDVAL